MCGIVGGWVPDSIPGRALDEAVASLTHRGPDDSGTLISGPRFLGARRLSIVDLEGGRQPQRNEDDSIAVVLNGEIYNHVELARELQSEGHQFRSRSDTEMLAHLYEKSGGATCDRLRGMFAFAVMDEQQNLLFLGREPNSWQPASDSEWLDILWSLPREGREVPHLNLHIPESIPALCQCSA